MIQTKTVINKLILNDQHEYLGAKMVAFADFLMPIQYEGINIEHRTVRQNVGLFDVSHMGEFIIEGEEAKNLIQWITSNDVNNLSVGKIQYSCLPNENGGIIDDLLVYQIAKEKFMLVVNASNIEKDWKWIQGHNRFKAKMFNISNEMSLLALQGPKAIQTLQKITNIDVSSVNYYSFKLGTIANIADILISATGYTGAGGFELYIPNEHVFEIWKALMDAGKEFGIKPIGLGARDTLRLEMGYCLYGNDIDDFSSPIEAGLGWITKFNEPFINSKNLQHQKESGVNNKLIGFQMIEKGIPRRSYNIYNSKKELIGFVTSGTQSPTLNKGIGLGYVHTSFSMIGSEIFVQIRDSYQPAKIVKIPFI